MGVQFFIRQKSYMYGLKCHATPKEHYDDNDNALSTIIFTQSAYIVLETSV